MARRETFCSLLILILLLLQLPVAASAERRTSLVIGNSNYEGNHLRTPGNDATDMATTLHQLGFEVTLLRDADRRVMLEAIETFSRQLRRGGVGLFYFAGHAIQVGGENYLIPLGSHISREHDVQYEAVPVGRILDGMEAAANELNIVILDASRPNPFGQQWQSRQRGLAASRAVGGLIIAYAVKPGTVASDDSGRNSLYTSTLLRYMRIPGLSIEQMFKRVRTEVMQASNEQQIPWETSSLVSDFAFAPGPMTPPVMPSPPSPSLGQPEGKVKRWPYSVVRVFYATDRDRSHSTKPATFFGTKRGEVTYGMCDVNIPKGHRMGALESPAILRLVLCHS